MDSDAEMMERHARLLGRFAEQAAGLAEDLYVAALAAENPAEKQSLSFAFHRMGRTLRQTCALEAKLRRDAKRQDHVEQDRGRKAAEARVAAHQNKLSAEVQRLIWTEAEGEGQGDTLKAELEDRLEIEVLDVEAFLAEPFEAQIARICAAIGLPLARPVRGAGGPSAERSEEPMVGGAGSAGAPAAPSTTPSAGRGPPPPRSGEAGRDDDDLLSDNDWRASG
ncbi:hypothetical protein [Phenylobacterium sp.]|uniref:hypothetical protein n=1 Tax=Phenylobacterium sp. TaxID=1871053 RepID=UPI002DF586B7|nr:hypothetical protein [Phenylobacterium sp.]